MILTNTILDIGIFKFESLFYYFKVSSVWLLLLKKGKVIPISYHGFHHL